MLLSLPQMKEQQPSLATLGFLLGSHLLLDDLRLLSFRDSGLTRVQISLNTVKLRHHLQNSLLLTHHLLHDLIEQLVRVLGHLQASQLLLCLARLAKKLLIDVRLRVSMVLSLAVISPVNQVLVGAHLPSARIVLPLSIHSVVALQEPCNLIIELAIKVSCPGVTGRCVELDHQVVDELEVVDVVDLLLVASQVEKLRPDLLIVPSNQVKLFGQVELVSLVVLHFFIPVSENDFALEVFVEQLPEMVTMELSVLPECFKQATDLLHSHVDDMILH